MTTNYSSLLDFELLQGDFTAIVTDFESVDALLADDNTIIRDAYVEVTFKLNTGDTITDRWFSKRLAFLMYHIGKQLDMRGCKLSALLNTMRTRAISINIDTDPRYGQQIDYSA